MFAQRIIERNTIGLVRHSVDEVNRAIKHFHDLADFDDDGEWLGTYKRPLDVDEVSFQRNESLLCKYDFHYASSRYAKILDWQKRLVNFYPNIPQQIKLELYADLEDREIALIMQALKARQLGSSTLDELIIWQRGTFWPNTDAVVGSSDPKRSAKMFTMVERAWLHTPFWLKPKCTKFSRGEFYEFQGIDSCISIQHGNQFAGISRGTTPNVGHLSEIVDYDDPRQLIDASLIRALHEHPLAFLSLESTANGRNDWWHTTWLANKENLASGMQKMYPIFLPWFVGTDIYPTETWLRARPIPQGWHPNDVTIAHAVKAAEYVERTPRVKRWLSPTEPYVMPIQQMWFYEVERKWAMQKNELNIFLSEMPANDEEAFQSRSGSIFPVEIISDRRDQTRLPQWSLSLEGDDIPQRIVVPARQHLSRQPLRIEHVNSTQHYKWRGHFTNIDSSYDPYNKLSIWEFPDEREQYEISVDTGYGVGEDRTVVQVGRRGTPERLDAQVAEWTSAYAGATDMWPIVMAIGRLYTSMGFDGRIIEPRITIEMAASGDALQADLRKRGWRNFYIRNRYGSALRSDNIIDPQLGWVTSPGSRPKLLDHLIKIVRDGLIDIRSPWLVDELADLQRSEKNYKIEAASGCHDDRLFAFAIMAYVMYDLDVRGEPTAVYRQRREAEQAASRAPEYTQGSQAAPTWAPGTEFYQ